MVEFASSRHEELQCLLLFIGMVFINRSGTFGQLQFQIESLEKPWYQYRRHCPYSDGPFCPRKRFYPKGKTGLRNQVLTSTILETLSKGTGKQTYNTGEILRYVLFLWSGKVDTVLGLITESSFVMGLVSLRSRKERVFLRLYERETTFHDPIFCGRNQSLPPFIGDFRQGEGWRGNKNNLNFT